ncbi:MAG: mechanosensitive ion channel domain-containing protein [Dehalococcoidia bacterium]
MAAERGRSALRVVIGAVGLPLLLMLLATVAFAAARLVPALDAYADLAARIEDATLVALGVWLVHRLLMALLDWTQRGGGRVVDRAAQVLPLGRRALNIATLVIGVLLVLDQLGISISPLLAGLGISGIAVALALQPLLTNLFAGSYVLSDASIRTGDYIAIQGGPAGRVEEIGWRATRLREVETDTLVIIPNATLAAATVTNYGAGTTVASVSLTLPRTTDLAAAERVAIEALRALAARDSRILGDVAPLIRFQAVTADAVTCLVAVRTVSQADIPGVTHEVVKALVPLFPPASKVTPSA